MAKMGLGDWGELITIGAGIFGSVATIGSGVLMGTGFIMKKLDETYEQRKLTQQRNEMTQEIAYMIKQEASRQQLLEDRMTKQEEYRLKLEQQRQLSKQIAEQSRR